MKPEVLDALLIDRSLGEVSPEVAELLDAYLSQNPGAAARAGEFTATLALARSTTALSRKTPRPIDSARLQRERDLVRIRARRTEALRLAACVALGLGVGWLLRPTHETGAPRVANHTVIVGVPARSVPQSPNFWSLAHFAPERVKTQSEKRL